MKRQLSILPHYSVVIGLLLLLAITGCKKDDKDSDPELKLPTLVTSEVSDITQNNAVCGGSITSDGGFSVTARGVCWSISPSPTINDAKTIDGAGGGNFVSEITGLIADTTYFVRAYATNKEGTSYGLSFNFRTLKAVLPDITTNNVSEIEQSTATCGGNITFNGGLEIITRGVCWNTNNVPTILNDTTFNGSGIGEFISHLTELVPNSTYYVRAYAINSKGVSYGQTEIFNTKKIPTIPTVITTSISQIASKSAFCEGSVTYNGELQITQRGFCWSTTPNPTLSDGYTSNGIGTGYFSGLIVNLEPQTTYYLKAYAINSIGTAYSDEFIFTTLEDDFSNTLLGLVGGSLIINGIPHNWDETLWLHLPSAIGGSTFHWTFNNVEVQVQGDGFKFREGQDWNGISIGYPQVTMAGLAADDFETNGDGNFLPKVAGVYDIELFIDALTEEYTVTVNPAGAAPELYLLGDGSLAGWDNTAALPLTGTGGVYTITTELGGAGKFIKFIEVLGQWAPQYGTDANGTNTGGNLVYRPDETTPDPPAIPCPDAVGTYVITANTNDLTYIIAPAKK